MSDCCGKLSALLDIEGPLNNSFLREILDTQAQFVACLCIENLHVCFSNTAFDACFSAKHGTLHGQSFLNLIVPEDHAKIMKILSGLLPGVEPESYRQRWIGREGRIHWIEWRFRRLSFQDQSLDCFLVDGKDITEYQLSNISLIEAHRALKVLSQGNQAVVYAEEEEPLLRQICEILVNEGGFRMAWIGWASDDKEQRIVPVAEAGFTDGYLKTIRLSWGDNEYGRGPSGIAVRTGKPSIVQDMLYNPQYRSWRENAIKRRYASSMAIPLVSEGKVLGCLNIYASEPYAFRPDEVQLLKQLADNLMYGVIHLRKNIELQKTLEHLEISQFRNKATLDSIPDLLFLINNEGVILQYTPPSKGTFPFLTQNLVGKKLEQIMPHDYMSWIKLLKGPSPDTGTVRDFEYVFKSEEKPVFFESRIVNVSAEELLLVIRDVTTQKLSQQALIRAKEEAEEMSRLKTSFLANMSHEIRTPLNSVLGFASLLKDQVQSEDGQTMVNYISKNGQRLLDTMNNIMDLAQLESMSGVTEWLECDLVAQCQSFLDAFAGLAREKGILLEFHTELKRFMIMTNPSMLTKILRKLMENALKFTKTGKIQIHLNMKQQEDQQEAVIIVEDTGVGISQDFLPHVFDEFKQESSGYNRSYEGTGLGLTITKKLVDLLHGRIFVESVKEKGSLFIVVLPVKPTDFIMKNL
ncbi:MAG: GAF domain-containing protein [SAR324 cluster bacterium]|nr:GAF domain-containing protein [SAR324 cluster bacterium]